MSKYTPVSGKCERCGDNCMKCNNNGAGKCDVGGCENGFLQMTGSTECITCFAGCTTCDTTDPNICLDCGDYKFLKNSKCFSCGTNCLSCTSATTCTKCIPGYLVNSNGACAVPPGPPCTQFNLAFACTACTDGFELTGGACSPSMSCNATSTCTNCPYNYYVEAGKCYPCPYIANCNSCNLRSKNKCQVCNTGFFVTAALTCRACN